MKLPSTGQLQSWFAPLYDLIDSAGESIVIREHTVVGQPLVDHTAIKARPNPVRFEDIKDGSLAKQGDFFLICKADSFPVARALEQRDRVRFRGRDYGVINDDSNQHAIGGIVYARVLHVRG